MGSAADAVRESHQTSGRMRSTWFLAPRTQWSWAMALLNDMQPHTTPAPPEHFGRLPAMSSAAALATFVPRVLAFVALQHAVHRAWRPLPLPAAVLYWSVAYQVCVGHAATLLLRMGAKWGFFDGARPRDKVPDLMTTKIAAGILWSCVVRIALGALFLYDAAAPVRVSLAAPLHLFVFAMALGESCGELPRAALMLRARPVLLHVPSQLPRGGQPVGDPQDAPSHQAPVARARPAR